MLSLGHDDVAANELMIASEVSRCHLADEPSSAPNDARDTVVMAPKRAFESIPPSCCKVPRNSLLVRREQVHAEAGTDGKVRQKAGSALGGERQQRRSSDRLMSEPASRGYRCRDRLDGRLCPSTRSQRLSMRELSLCDTCSSPMGLFVASCRRAIGY